MIKKIGIILILIICLFTISAVSAEEIGNETDNPISTGNTPVNEPIGEQANASSQITSENNNGKLSANEGTYSELIEKIGSGGNITLNKKIYTYDSGFTIEITQSGTIDGNGAIIDMSGSDIQVFNVNATNLIIKNITFKNINYYGAGGAIYFAGSGTVNNCNFTGNTAGNGGAIYFKSTGSVSNCNFVNNLATAWGGAIYFKSTGSVSNCNFVKNRATECGGAIYSEGSVNNLFITNCNFTANTANDCGGAIYCSDSEINNCNFTGNTAGSSGGAIACSDSEINNCNFTGNTASSSGGAISSEGSVNNLFITNCNFRNNTANDCAGAIVCSGSNINNCNFTGNTANYGGAIHGGKYVVNVVNSTFVNNIAENEGGAIYWSGDSADIKNCNFTGNTANEFGGAFYNFGYSATSFITNCNFRNNAANESGGAIYNYAKGDSIISKCNFLNNSAPNTRDIYSNALLISDTTFIPSGIGNKIYYSVSNDVLYDKCIIGGMLKMNSNSTLILNLVDVLAPNVTKYYNGSERFVVTLKDNNVPLAGKDVIITLNGVAYTRKTNSNGQASIAINLNSGVYNVTTEYGDIKVYSTVTVKSTVIADDLTKMYRNGSQYYATFVDSQGKLLPKGTEVKFNINGVMYIRKTNENGVAKLNINLNPATYIITAINPANNEMHSNKITVLSIITENKDLTKYYRNATQYTLRLLGDNGKPVGAGESVTFNINGVFYNRTTNASGYAKLNINLGPGTYIITAEYKGLKASNTVVVKSVLFTKDLSMKYRDGSKFEAKVLDGQGKPLSGATVTFNINGVFYNRVTGDDGIARLNINLNPGEYIITSSYNGLGISNKIIINSNSYVYTAKSGDKMLVENDIIVATYSASGQWIYNGQYSGMNIKEFKVMDDILSKYGMSDYSAYLLDGNPEIPNVDVDNFRYDRYNYWYEDSNPDSGYTYINLPSYDTTTTTKVGRYTIEIEQWRSPGMGELDIMVCDSSGNLVNKYNVESKVLVGSTWYGPYSGYERAAYHKWHFDPDARVTQVAIQLIGMHWS